MFVPAVTTHLCLGAPYGWSAISHRLSMELGLVRRQGYLDIYCPLCPGQPRAPRLEPRADHLAHGHHDR